MSAPPDRSSAGSEPSPGGGFARFAEVYRQELLHDVRRPLFWFLLLILGFFAWQLSLGHASIGSGDARVGGTKAFITSEFALTQLMVLLVSVVYSFFVSVGAGMSLIREGELNVGALLHSTRLTTRQYVWGKYLAVTTAFALVLAVHIALMMLFNHVMPHGDNRDVIGPFVAMNYLKPAIVFALPLIVLSSGLAFAIGGLTRQPVLVFVLPVTVLFLGLFFLWDWSPAWLAPAVNRALQFVDLTGFRWINETWLTVDRGVDFYNRQPVGLDVLVIAQRVAALLVGLLAVLLVEARFAARLRGTKGDRGASRAAAAAAIVLPSPDPAPLSAFAMTARPPGFWAGSWEVARVEWRELWKHPGLYLFVPMILIQIFGDVVRVGAFDTPLLATPGLLAVSSMNTLTLLVCMLILFYNVEALQREKSSGLAPIQQSTPLSTASIVFGKCLANSALGVAVILATLLGCAVVLLIQGKVAFDPRPFALVWGLLLMPTFLLWTAFVCAAWAATSNRFGTYIVGLAAMSLTGFFQARDRMTWTFNWNLWSAVRWSDIAVLELDRVALLLNRLLALGLAAFFVVLTARLMTRRERDATRVVHALRPGPLARAALAMLPFALVPIACGVALAYLVHDGRQGAATRKEQRDYWKKNVLTWRDTKNPSLSAVDLDLDFDPARGRLESKGEYTMVNRTSDTLRAVAMTSGLHWRNVSWTLDGAAAKPEERAHLHVFRPARPLAPGDRVRIGFRFDGRFPDGVSRNQAGLGEFVLPSGVVLTGFSTTGMVPAIGYVEDIGVEKDKNDTDPREYPDDYWRRTLPAGLPMFDGWCDTHIRIQAPAYLQHNATGNLVSESVTNGRRVTEWRSDAPVRAFNVVLGRWQVKKRGGAAVYYDARHPYNVDEMLDGLVAARRWYGEWFAPFPWRELRLSEFPGLATYAQGPPNNITFSENIGFLTRSEPKANAAFWVTAHEAAHQWWPNLAMPGEGPGSDVLSEGLAHFSTILLIEQARGLEQRIAFCKSIEDRYGDSRQRDSERPLVKVDGSMPGDNRIIYDRGGFVLWMLHRRMGREASFAAHRDYLETYRNSEDHPLIEEYLAVLRRHAPDTTAFDGFVNQWLFGTVVPQYQVIDPTVVATTGGWEVRARIRNTGTGTEPVEIAAVRGERFPKKRTSENAWSDRRTTLTLAAGEEKPVVLTCSFEPQKLVVDPDATLLMLQRQKSEVRLRTKGTENGPVARN